ncbi:MAG: WecB/TagA/CpsF family glycosyltransferase [Candidatus Methylacidiphilales bacterium]|nr:WecB/TagA/CpsF family glycosyltransferase [Candidatus Methylacidiphilales bacterium]
MPERVKYLSLLGTRIACVDYREALRACQEMVRREKPGAVSACNTHIVSQARHSPSFRQVMDRFDLVLPDGMPLIWALNFLGAGLKDRVYGPYFMRYALQNAAPGTRHFFFGGTEETLALLQQKARELNPDIVIAGTCSPPFRPWTGDDQEDFARRIRQCGADFIWVALGGERQEAWIVENLGRHTRGVFFAVGDAFALLAGQRPFAPDWMQAMSLTWLYRLMQEPRRLWRRYARYNALFVYYLIRDGCLGVGRPAAQAGQPSIAFIGSRGVPARYSGFETVVEELGRRLAADGYQVVVYNRWQHYRDRLREYLGMHLRWYPTLPTKNLESIVHTSLSYLDTFFRRYDIIYVCGVGNTPWGRYFNRLTGSLVVINVDGADFKRKKWGPVARWWLRRSEKRAVSLGDAVIADNLQVVRHYQREYGHTPKYISYGAPIRTVPIRQGELERWGLVPKGYLLHVSRLSPENETDLLLRAHRNLSPDEVPPLVIVGSAGYEKAYERELRNLASDRVIFTGGRYAEAYVELSQNALFFVMPAAIEATRLVLLDQMGMAQAILYQDCEATREVVADAGMAFGGENCGSPDALCADLSDKMRHLAAQKVLCHQLGQAALERARTQYSWERVAGLYRDLFHELQSKRAEKAGST